MYKIAVLDDDKIFLVEFAKKLEKYKEECHFYFYTDSALLKREIDRYDAIFIDYQMPKETAYTFFESIKGKQIEKVVISNHNHVVYQGFKYGFFWFLRKEYLEQELPDMMIKLIPRLYEQRGRLKIRSTNKEISIPFNDIYYIIVDRNYLIVHSVVTYRLRCSFTTILDKLESRSFVMPKYGILVNVGYIKYIDFTNTTIITLDDKKIAISRGRKQEVIDKYRAYKCQ